MSEYCHRKAVRMQIDEAVCYRIGWNKGIDEARHVIMMILQRGEQNDD